MILYVCTDCGEPHETFVSNCEWCGYWDIDLKEVEEQKNV